MLLFSAPVDFAPEVVGEYLAAFDCDFIPAFTEGELIPDPLVTVWVCNPKARFVIGDNVLAKFPGLQVLATPSTGSNHINHDACKRRAVKVVSLLDDRKALEGISASAEFTFKLILDALRLPPKNELQGRRVGIVGYGRIGRCIALWTTAFGAFPVVCDPQHPASISLADIFAYCDVVVLCCTLDGSTRGMVTETLVRSMRENAVLVNTSRGEVIDEPGLLRALDARPDLRLALDVIAGETTGTANPDALLDRGVIVTPHIAGETVDSRTKAARIILGLLRQLETTHG